MTPLLPSFTELGVPADIVAALADRSITAPFPIQAATLADALAGRDVCGKAPTGSGKTLAFGIGAVVRLGPGKARPKHPRALVLTPTRELCAQVASELDSLARARNLRVATFYGGVGYGPQLKALARGVDIAVACPGRLRDLIDRRSIHLDAVEVVVIDEADRMADMGFLPEVRRLLDLTPDDRQTVLFSATLDGDIDVLVRRYQTDPVRHEQESEEEAGDALHLFWKMAAGDRIDATASVVVAAGPTIVFSRTKHGADRIARQLDQRGVRSAAIHGDRSQRQRERALELFAGGGVDALVATDVAARGIHVDGVTAVVHFDPPADAKDYVHRSGRTARAGADGVVVTLVTPEKSAAVRRLQREAGVSGPITALDLAPIADVLGPPPVRRTAAAGSAGGSAPTGRTPGADGARRAEGKPRPRPSASGPRPASGKRSPKWRGNDTVARSGNGGGGAKRRGKPGAPGVRTGSSGAGRTGSSGVRAGSTAAGRNGSSGVRAGSTAAGRTTGTRGRPGTTRGRPSGARTTSSRGHGSPASRRRAG